MTTLKSITTQMNVLEIEIAIQQKYISKHGEKNDSGEYDKQWEQYKEDAEYNLSKWDFLKQERNKLK